MSDHIEPGVLPIARWFYGVMFVLVGLGFCSPALIPDYFSYVVWGVCGLLSAYFNAPKLARWMGASYLPLGLWTAVLTPILADAGANVVYMTQGVTDHALMGDGTRLYFWLIPPLVLISAQYSLRVMFTFTIGSSLLPLLLSYALNDGFLIAQITHSTVRITLYSVMGYLVVSLSRAQRQQRIELAQKNIQLTHYAATLEQLTVARERNRMARELHDTLAHTLSAMNVQLRALEVLWDQDANKARAALHEAQELTKTGLKEARRALDALRASPVEDLGLVLALERLANQSARSGGLTLTLHLTPHVYGLPAEFEHHVYRVAEEALNNVLRHAHAQQVALRLEYDSTILRLTVTDDGVGFEFDGVAAGHYGLMGIRERAAGLQGKLTLNSRPSRGTTLIFEVPLPQGDKP